MKNDSMPRGSGSILDENIFGVGGGGEEEARGAGVMQLFLGKMTFSQHAVWRRTGQARPGQAYLWQAAGYPNYSILYSTV